MIIDIFCQNVNLEKAFARKIYRTNNHYAGLWDKYVTDILETYTKCPHFLKGKTLQIGSFGGSPYMFIDFYNNVVYDEQGLPAGSNTGIAKTLSKVFGFKFNILIYNKQEYFNPATGKWSGILGDVIILHYSV